MSHGRLIRLILALQEYNINWKYVPVHKNTVAGVLSRVILEENSCEVVSGEVLKICHMLKQRTDYHIIKEIKKAPTDQSQNT